MRGSLTAAAVIVGSAAALVGAGTFSVFNDTATGSGTLKTGTVALSLSGAKTASLPVNPTCTLPFTSAIGQRDNLGTANNTDCTASVSVSNAGSLPFTLAGSGTQVTDSLVGGVSCWTSTITDGATTGQVVLPGASQVVKLKTANTNDAAVCQGKTDNVTLSLTATEARPAGVGQLFQDFENGAAGWTTTGDFGIGVSSNLGARSGTKSAGAPLSGRYSNGTTSTLTSPPVDLTGVTSASLTFAEREDVELYNDCGSVEVSTNNGNTWAKAIPVGGYPGSPSDFPQYQNATCTAGGNFNRTQGFAPWTTYTVNLMPYAGYPQVRVRFVLKSNAGTTAYYGFGIDDVRITSTPSAS